MGASMKTFINPLAFFLYVLTIVVGFVGYRTYDTLGAVKANAVSSLAIETEILAPCSGKDGKSHCGTLAQVDQTVKNLGAMAAQSQQQVRQTADVIKALQASLVAIQTDVHTEIGSLTKATDATTALLKAGTGILGILNDPKTGLKPILAATQSTVADTDTAVKGVDTAVKTVSPQVVRATKSVADNGEQVLVVSTNAAKVSTHYEKQIDDPKPMSVMQKLKMAGEVLWKLAMVLK